MKRHSIWITTLILIFSVFCLPSLCSAITVQISEVSPTWIPEASESDDLSIAWVSVTISGITNRDQYKKIEISLTTSMLSGICGNSTNQDIVDTGLQNVYNSTIRDLIFRTEENGDNWEVVSKHKLRYTVPSEDEKRKATVTLPVGVLCLDFGAHGRLLGGVKKRNDNDDTSATLPTPVRIPRDDNNNNIADSWNNDYYALDTQGNLDSSQFRRFGTDSDVDTSLNSVHSGDRLTAFEEYRGFMTWPYAPASGRAGSDPPSVRHTRTSPDAKDMFIVNENSETKYRGTGTGHGRLSQHLLPSSHVNANGQVDFRENRGDAAYSVEVVTNDQIQNDPPYGEAEIGPPRADAEATIYTSYIKLQEGSYANQVISDVIGHEMGHWAHLGHCPELTDTNGDSWEDKCRMYWEYDRDQNEYALHHDRDYALKKVHGASGPQGSAEPNPPDGERNPQRGTLSSGSSLYTATAGGSHTANFVAPSAYSSVYWYVKSPTDTTTYGTNVEIDQGDGSTTTASLSYTFSSSAAAGNWTIMAYVYPGSGSVYELSYTVYVSRPIVVFSPSFSVGSSSYSAGNTLYGTVTSSSSDPIYGSHLLVKAPSDTSAYGMNMGWFPGNSIKTTTSLSLSYSIPSDATAGSYQITARVYPWNGDTWGTPVYLSENVTVTAATSTTTTTTTTPTTTTTTQSFDPSLSGNASTYSPGSTLTATVSTSGAPIYGARLYHGSTDLSGWVPGSKSTTSVNLSYTFPTDASGSYDLRVSIWPWNGDTYGSVYRLYFTVNVQ